MRIAALVMLTLSLFLGAFCYWGIYTRPGQRRFDEMAGMIPFGAGVAGGVMLLVGSVLLLVTQKR